MARMVASEKCVNVANSSLATKMHEIPDVTRLDAQAFAMKPSQTVKLYTNKSHSERAGRAAGAAGGAGGAGAFKFL